MTLNELNSKIINCGKCKRLVKWREQVAIEKIKRFEKNEYWGKPVTGFGCKDAKLLIVGLAPAAHGANRTGRMFTGDRSGEWLYRTLYKFGFSNKPNSENINDGLAINNCYITAACRCAPPNNKPLTTELNKCQYYLEQEIQLLKNLQAVCGLGKIGFDWVAKCLKRLNLIPESTRLIFGHGRKYFLKDDILLIGSYHPSQQNTFTKKLTQPMFDNIFRKIKKHLENK